MKQGRRLGLGVAGWAGWTGRKWRGVRPDGNPLRRRLDRVEAVIFGALIVAAMAGAPVAAALGGHWAYVSAQQAARVQRETSHQVQAVLLAVPGSSPGGYSVTPLVAVQARWTAPNGAVRTGEIAVPAASVKDKTVPVWTDSAGDLTSTPMTPAQVADQGTFGTAIAVVLTLVTLFVAAGITRFIVNRRRIAAWAADWAVTAPVWTRQRW
jgi:hypothetical protein